MAVFSKESLLNFDPAEVFAWHARPGAIQRLSPPWDPLEVLEQTGGILPGARVVLRMKAGPVPYRWQARHTRYEEGRLFEDEQVRGPFARWIHTHAFEPAGDNGCRLRDTIDFRLPFHGLTGPLAEPVVRRLLARIFAYRHRITRADLGLHRSFADQPRQTVLISGADGLIGSRLAPFLTTGGHRVVKLVRRQPRGDNEIFWNPAADRVDARAIAALRPDAVIHLAGENIGQGRWTAAKKKRIIDSREKGTRLIATTLARLSPRPQTLLSASAIGWYGNRGDLLIDETAGPGLDFISHVCRLWEEAVQPAVEAGIRVVRLRIGVILTPEGGALQKMLPLFRLGLGGRIGSGRQFLSWIGMDDAIGALYWLLMRSDISGPVNIVAPEPVTNAEFTRGLAEVLRRPALFPVPATLIKAVFGQMGKEVALGGTRVWPAKLFQIGYPFQHPDLRICLAHLLGVV